MTNDEHHADNVSYRFGHNVRFHSLLTQTTLTGMRWHSVIHVLGRFLLFETSPLGLIATLSVQRGGVVEIIANDQGHRITPSWVSFTDEERLYVYG
jgi:hypothetical protein